MSDGIREAKREARRSIRARIAALPEITLAKSNEAIYNILSGLPELLAAKTVFAYHSVGREVDTLRLLQLLRVRGQRTALPVTRPAGEMAFALYEPEELEAGLFADIPEPPAEAAEVCPEAGDVILVPALTYDRDGYRQGQGGGYYDRYLASHDVCAIGLGRDALLLDRVLRESHDQPVDLLVTESGVRRFRRACGGGSLRSPLA